MEEVNKTHTLPSYQDHFDLTQFVVYSLEKKPFPVENIIGGNPWVSSKYDSHWNPNPSCSEWRYSDVRKFVASKVIQGPIDPLDLGNIHLNVFFEEGLKGFVCMDGHRRVSILKRFYPAIQRICCRVALFIPKHQQTTPLNFINQILQESGISLF